MTQNKNRTIYEILTKRAHAMKMENGDMFEIVQSETSEDQTKGTFAVQANKHGHILIDSFAKVTGKVPEPYALALMNLLARTTATTMRKINEDAIATVTSEMNADGFVIVAPLMEPFFMAMLAGYLTETQERRARTFAMEPTQNEGDIYEQMLRLVMEIGDEYGERSARAAMNHGKPEDTVMGANGAMFRDGTDLADPKKTGEFMAIARALAGMATGQKPGQA